MANIASSSVAIVDRSGRGGAILKELCETLEKALGKDEAFRNALDPDTRYLLYRPPCYIPLYLGEVVDGKRWDGERLVETDEVPTFHYFRGGETYVDYDGSSVLYIGYGSAWDEGDLPEGDLPAFLNAYMHEHYGDDFEVFYQCFEPGCEYYITNDAEGEVFPARYVVTTEGPEYAEDEYENFDNVRRDVKDFLSSFGADVSHLPHEKEAFIQSVDKLCQDLNKQHGGEWNDGIAVYINEVVIDDSPLIPESDEQSAQQKLEQTINQPKVFTFKFERSGGACKQIGYIENYYEKDEED